MVASPLPLLTLICNPVPDGCNNTSSPAISPAVPLGAEILPLLLTDLPISTTSPVFDVMLPWFVTTPEDVPVNCRLPPCMKASLPVSRVEATKLPPVTTLPVGMTTTPFSLIR